MIPADLAAQIRAARSAAKAGDRDRAVDLLGAAVEREGGSRVLAALIDSAEGPVEPEVVVAARLGRDAGVR